jgi:hypothetical protein
VTQNTSTAVMQRRVEAHDSLDDFPTPPWATRALCEFLETESDAPLRMMIAREPAANRGHMVTPLREYFGSVVASDVHDYGAGYPVADYLFPTDIGMVDWTITNPPFRLAEQFIERFERLFSTHQPAHVLQFTERVVMHKGVLSATGSTATAYCWIVWRASSVGRMANPSARLSWIAPCRKRLERPSDYVVAA